jgi:ribosome biogenesis GTPase
VRVINHNANTSIGLVLARYGQQVDVEMPNGEVSRIYLKRRFSDVVTGDRVRLEKDRDQLTIVSHEPRTSVLGKPDPRRGQQDHIKPIAANIDQILLVIAPKPVPSYGLIDDYLVMAEALGIKPIIVFNKTDLLTPHSYQTWQETLSLYSKLTYSVVFTNRSHLESLCSILNQKTSILVGQSGVGKSSIIQQLLPTSNIRTAEISLQDHGKHTTTTTYLYHLPCGGNLIDSPGVRSFSLWPMPAAKIAPCFIEFRPYLGHCRFNNCDHRKEPDCAILAALKQSNIMQSRYDSYERQVLIHKKM